MTKPDESWLDKAIAYCSPAWAYKRRQYRAALKQAQQPVEPRRPDRGGWVGIDDERNPLNPNNLERARAERLAGKRWL